MVKIVLDDIKVVDSLMSICKNLEEAFQFVAEGKVVPIAKKLKLKEVNDIFEEIAKGEIKVCMVVDMNKK